jgi:hypothetical protein
VGWQIAPDALVTSNRARSRMVAYPPIPKCSQQLAAPGMEKLAVVLWWHFHLMRPRFSPYGDKVNLSRCFYAPPFSRYA